MEDKQTTPVRSAKPRETAQVRFPDGRTFEAPVETPLEQYVKVALGDSPVPFIAALVNGDLRELTYPMRSDARVDPVFLSDSDGVRIYRRSLSFLLVTVVRELFPDAQIFVDHTLPFGGFFCQVRGRESFSAEELARIEARMRQIVAEDTPIRRGPVPLEEAIEIFRARDEVEKVQLLARRQKDYLSLYTLLDSRDYFHGYMVPSFANTANGCVCSAWNR
jgi:uridine kinase